MKVDPILKRIFYLTFIVLYVSGVAEYVMQLAASGPSPGQWFALRVHGIVGLWFLYFFGHFFSAHIWPSLRQIRHRKTGITVWIFLIVLSGSVPFLYYLSSDCWRDWTALLHTYLGLLIVIPLSAHIYLSICRR